MHSDFSLNTFGQPDPVQKFDKKGHDGVEGTTYNHGRPEGISEDQHPVNQFLGMLYGQVRP